MVVHSTRVLVEVLTWGTDGSWPQDPIFVRNGDRLRVVAAALKCALTEVYTGIRLAGLAGVIAGAYLAPAEISTPHCANSGTWWLRRPTFSASPQRGTPRSRHHVGLWLWKLFMVHYTPSRPEYDLREDPPGLTFGPVTGIRRAYISARWVTNDYRTINDPQV